MKKTLRLTRHAKERIDERLPLPIKKIVKLFQGSIYINGKNGIELHENEGIIFVVKLHSGYKYHLITLYKKVEEGFSL